MTQARYAAWITYGDRPPIPNREWLLYCAGGALWALFVFSVLLPLTIALRCVEKLTRWKNYASLHLPVVPKEGHTT